MGTVYFFLYYISFFVFSTFHFIFKNKNLCEFHNMVINMAMLMTTDVANYTVKKTNKQIKKSVI